MANDNSDNEGATAVKVTDVRLTYPAQRRRPAHDALRGIDLHIPAGQSVALLGPNGSGKSTLMKIICAMMPLDTGSVHVFGHASPDQIRRRLSVVFQSNGLDPHLTVVQNLRCQAALYGLDSSQTAGRIEEELNRADLTSRRNTLVKTLSLGLARRVDLVRAMLHHPQLLLLDEPTTGLDPVARTNFLEELDRRRRDMGLTLMMSTHLIDEADRCERVVFIHQGRIVADDSRAVLRRSLGGRMVTVHGTDPLPPEIQSVPTDGWVEHAGSTTAHVGDDRDVANTLASILTANHCAFTMAPPTLADVFAHLTGTSLADDDADDVVMADVSTQPMAGDTVRT